MRKWVVLTELIGVSILLMLVGVNAALTLLSQASDVSVLVGTILLLAVLGVMGGIVHRLIHWYRDHHLLVLLLVVLGVIGCTRVDPGHVGIKVNYYGGDRGVQDLPLVTGAVLYNPFTTTVFQYPTFTQTAVWTRSLTEGHPQNEEISFNSREGLVFTSDISLSYTLDAKLVPHFYVKFRSDHLDLFTHGFLRNIARDAFNEEAAQFTAEEVYGVRKEELLKNVRARINAQVGPFGVRLEQFGFIGAPRPPENVARAINMKIGAIQDAIRVENEVRQARAEAQKAVAKATGEAQANELLARSLTPVLLQWRQLEITNQAIAKWDGRRPMVEGTGAGLLLNVNPRP